MGEGGEEGKGTNHRRVISLRSRLRATKVGGFFQFSPRHFNCSRTLFCVFALFVCIVLLSVIVVVIAQFLLFVDHWRWSLFFALTPSLPLFFSLSFFGPAISTLSLFKSGEEESANFVSQMLSPSSYFPILKVIVQ